MAENKDISALFDEYKKSENKEEKEEEKEEAKEEAKEEKEEKEEVSEEEKEEEKPEEESKPEPKAEEDKDKEEEKPKEEPKKDVVNLNFTKPKNEEEAKQKMAFSSKEPKEGAATTNTTTAKPVPTPVAKTADDDFDLSPAKPGGKHIIMIYGLKGAGKTSLAFSFPGSHSCLSFDNKSSSIAEQTDKTDKIVVYDGSRYMDKSSGQAWLESSEKSWRYINKILDSIGPEQEPDWMVVDGGEIFHQMAEMVMRYRNNLMPFQGITNRNIWKERRMYIDQLLRKCLKKCKKGVIWTSYIDKEEIIADGDYVAKTDVPRWIDAVLYLVDSLIKVERETTKSGQCFHATVESSKWVGLPETAKTDITDKGIVPLIKGEI